MLDERSRRRWAAAESRPSAMAVTRWCLRLPVWRARRSARDAGRLPAPTRRRAAFGRRERADPGFRRTNPAFSPRLRGLWTPVTRGAPTSPLGWTCKSRAKQAAALTQQGWRVSSTTVGRLLRRLGYRLQSVRKRREVAVHPERNITADAGGSYGYRSRAWKHELQQFADETGLAIHVSHFPPGTSKWNKDRVPTLLPRHRELARDAADDLRDHRRPHRQHEDGGRFASSRLAGHETLSYRCEGDRVGGGRAQLDAQRISRGLELPTRCPVKPAILYRSLSLLATLNGRPDCQ